MGATHGTTAEIDTDPEGVEQPMKTGFVRPLQGRDPLFVPIRGLSPTAIHIDPRWGWEMRPQCLIQQQCTPALSPEAPEEREKSRSLMQPCFGGF